MFLGRSLNRSFGIGRTYATAAAGQRERLAVIGSGWAGFSAVRKLDVNKYDITVISPRTYFAFTPLLASTAVGTLEYRVALESVRGTRKVHLFQAWADKIDFERKTITCQPVFPKTEPRQIEYDKVVISPGCYAQTFGVPGVKENGFFLKDVTDARKIRSRILDCFEAAAVPGTPQEEKERLLSFYMVGGGPTGVELAAEIHDLTYQDLKYVFPDLVPLVKISIIDVAPQILSAFDAKLGEYASRKFRREGISILSERHIERVEKTSFVMDGERVQFGLLVWATGLAQNPLIAAVEGMRKAPKTGNLLVSPHLRLLKENGEELRDAFAAGDCCTIEKTGVLPATAQVASQQGLYLAKTLNAAPSSDSSNEGTVDVGKRPPFVFRDRGAMAYIGGTSAIMQSGGDKHQITGRAAWVLWRMAYLTMTMSVRNKILVPVYWAINALLGRDISRF